MITFYPRDIGIWRNSFDFAPDITLTPKEKTNYKVFKKREELIDFLKEHGITLNDPKYPLKFESINYKIYNQDGMEAVIQWTCLGWIKDDFR
jgi:hypothetical protein